MKVKFRQVTASSLLVSLALAFAGCGGSPATTAAPQAAAPPTPVATKALIKPKATLAAETAPEIVVSAFFDAMRKGDNEIIASLLTDKAWHETQLADYQISASGMPTAQYQTGKIEVLNNPQTGQPDRARVASLLSDLDDNGVQVDREIYWLLRLQADGWRIAGMAVPTDPSQPPAIFDFEDAKYISSVLGTSEGEDPTETAATQQARLPDATVQQK